MDFILKHILTFIIFSPLLGIALISLVPRKYEEGVRPVALFSSILTFLLVVWVWLRFHTDGFFQFREVISWVPSLNIYYHLGVDGVSLLMVALTSILTPLCVAGSWVEIKTSRKEFYIILLACEIGLLGAFCALDLFLFYVFWEVMLIPMYFLIGIWGSGNRIYVSLKFLLYTLVGSVLMLVGVIALYLKSGNSFNMLNLGIVALPKNVQIWLFLSFAVAFAIKVPMWPFHTWLPDAHTEAPTAGSVLLAGVFLKAGAYGFYRIAMPYFPEAVEYFRPLIFILATVGIVYGALVSMVQTDFKRLIAYSSVSHLGFVILGLISLNPEGVSGAVLQMFNHGVSTGALFLLFGMLYGRYHTREISDYGGIARIAPFYSGIFIFVGISSLGLPGLNNFVGEMLTLIGAFKAKPVFAIISATGVIFAAVYMLWAVERVFFGKIKSEHVKDMSAREFVTVLPLIILIVLLGVFPNIAISRISDSVENFILYAKRSVIDTQESGENVIVPIYERKEPEIILPEMKMNEEVKSEAAPGEEKYSDPVDTEETTDVETESGKQNDENSGGPTEVEQPQTETQEGQ